MNRNPPSGLTERELFVWNLGFNAGATESEPELRESAYDYAHLIQVENYDRNDIAVHRSYERLRKALGEPVGLDLEKAS